MKRVLVVGTTEGTRTQRDVRRRLGSKEENAMRYLKYFALLAVLGFLAAAPSQAQVRWGIGIGVGPGYYGPAPVCAYGYYSYYPYDCAPYGYYGPDWFVDGVFI